VPPPPADDQALVDAARQGDRQAFRALYERYERRIYALALAYLRHKEDALDVVQEAFIKVHRHLDNFQGQSSFYTWLYRVTANLCIDHLRRSAKRRGVEFDDGLDHEVDDGSNAARLSARRFERPDDALADAQVLSAVQDALGGLSDKHRSVIVMRELQGLSYAEMAGLMQCSKGTIMSRLFHARRNMQRLLRERLGDDAVPAVFDDSEAAEEAPAGRARTKEVMSP
jgi:RNA polymerase sigma-70 factor (ECF subfamily)